MILLYMVLFAFSGVLGDYNWNTSKAIRSDTKEVYLENDDVYTWSSSFPYLENDGQSLIVRVDDGYKVLITIKILDIDGESGDLLLVKSGSSLDDDHTGRIFTYVLKSERTYVSYTNEAFLSFEVYGENVDEHNGFIVTIERFGEEITTTEFPPTPEVTWPTPEEDDTSIYLTVYLSGRSANDYREESVRIEFQTVVASMATEYCETNNFNLSEAITYANVHINYLVQCPINWPKREKCVQIQFSLPVILSDDSPFHGYQLTTDHLEIMWERFSPKYFDSHDVPNAGQNLKLWMLILCVIVLVFIIVLYVIRKFGIRFEFNTDKAFKRRLSDTAKVSEQNTEVYSRASLGPHPLQSVPELFEYEYPVYEPDLTSATFHADDLDDTEDDDLDLNLKHFSLQTKELTESSEL